ncbi:MAG: helix-turn-helix domain-containing protein [Bacteroidaceae bacterium]|nr:helix-turn-helix domain-containing protein [Bacteroidaceae bacterium]
MLAIPQDEHGQSRRNRHSLVADFAESENVLSVLKNEKAKAIRFTTLDALCRALDCQPGDLLEYVGD